MPWPTKLAYRLTAQFFRIEYGESARRLLLEDLPIKDMVFFNPNATPESNKVTATLVATQLIKHMEETLIPLEDNGDLTVAMQELSETLANGEKASVEIGAIIDNHFKFADEISNVP